MVTPLRLLSCVCHKGREADLISDNDNHVWSGIHLKFEVRNRSSLIKFLPFLLVQRIWNRYSEFSASGSQQVSEQMKAAVCQPRKPGNVSIASKLTIFYWLGTDIKNIVRTLLEKFTRETIEVWEVNWYIQIKIKEKPKKIMDYEILGL